MSRFKAKVKQKSSYPGILTRAEELRKRVNLNKFGYNTKTKVANAQLLQRFSGKRGK